MTKNLDPTKLAEVKAQFEENKEENLKRVYRGIEKDQDSFTNEDIYRYKAVEPYIIYKLYKMYLEETDELWNDSGLDDVAYKLQSLRTWCKFQHQTDCGDKTEDEQLQNFEENFASWLEAKGMSLQDVLYDEHPAFAFFVREHFTEFRNSLFDLGVYRNTVPLAKPESNVRDYAEYRYKEYRGRFAALAGDAPDFTTLPDISMDEVKTLIAGALFGHDESFKSVISEIGNNELYYSMCVTFMTEAYGGDFYILDWEFERTLTGESVDDNVWKLLIDTQFENNKQMIHALERENAKLQKMREKLM